MTAARLPRPIPPAPVITIDIAGPDGNVFAVIGIAGAAMLDAGCSANEVCLMREAVFRSADYDDALRAVALWAPVAFCHDGDAYVPGSRQ